MLSDKYSLVKLSLVFMCLAVFLSTGVMSKSVAVNDDDLNNSNANVDGSVSSSNVMDADGGLDEVAARLARIRLYRSLIRNEEAALSQMISTDEDEDDLNRRKKSNNSNMKNYLKRGMKTMALGFGK